jgi:hypothetical protein
MLTRIHLPSKYKPPVDEDAPTPEEIKAERAAELDIFAAESVVRLAYLAASLGITGDEAAQIVSEAMRPGQCFIEALDSIIKDEGIEVEEAYRSW